MTVRTAVGSWVAGVLLVGITPLLLIPEISRVEYWDGNVRPDLGFFQFPEGPLVKPFWCLLLVLGFILGELLSLVRRRPVS
jgi:hypothetical protein